MRASNLRLELYLVERRGNPLHTGHCVLAKGNTGLVSAHQHGFDIRSTAQNSQERDEEEIARGIWQDSEAIPDRLPQGVDFTDVGHVSETAVDVELGILGVDVVVGNVRRHVDRDLGGLESWRIVTAHYALYGFVQHPQIHVETDGVDESGLLGSEQVPCTPQLEILERDLVAGSE